LYVDARAGCAGGPRSRLLPGVLHVRDQFDAGFLELGDVLEAADRQAQVQFGEKRLEEVGEAFAPP
jgi:hypothetical protein